VNDYCTLPPKSQDLWYIYVLLDPRDENHVRYVGMTIDPFTRYKNHLRCEGANKRKNDWLAWVQLCEVVPEMRIIASGHGDGWKQAEQRWIRHYRDSGCDLLNLTSGGQSGYSHGPYSEAQRARRKELANQPHRLAIARAVGERMRGRKLSDEHREKIGAAHLGQKRSAEARAKMSAAARRPEAIERTRQLAKRLNPGRLLTQEQRQRIAEKLRNPTPETRAKMSASHTGKKRSPESLAKFSEKMRGHPVSEETRAKISAAHKGLTPSPETRAKMSASAKLRHEREKGKDTQQPLW
jgi:hypothetical protein